MTNPRGGRSLDVPMNRARRITLLGLAVVIVLFAAAGSSGSILPELRADGDDKRLRPSRSIKVGAINAGTGASGIYGAKVDGSNRHLITRYKGGARQTATSRRNGRRSGQSLTYWTRGERIMLRPGGYPDARRSQDAPIGSAAATPIPTWSPDGRQIAFSGENPITSRRPISIVSLASGRVRRLHEARSQTTETSRQTGRLTEAAIAFERDFMAAKTTGLSSTLTTLDGRERQDQQGVLSVLVTRRSIARLRRR